MNEKQVRSMLQELVSKNTSSGSGKINSVQTMNSRLFVTSDDQMYELRVTVPMSSTIERVLNPPAPKEPKAAKPKASTAAKAKAPAPAKEIKPSTSRARARSLDSKMKEELAAEAAANA